MLLYPVTYHPSAGHSSYTENASGYRLEANLMRWFWQQYAPDVSRTDPNVSPPQLQEVPSLTPTLVATAECDVLRDEGCRNLLRTSHGLRRLDSGCRAHRPPCIGRNTRRPRRIVPSGRQPLGWGAASVERFDSAEDLLNGYCPLPGSGITSGFVSANL